MPKNITASIQDERVSNAVEKAVESGEYRSRSELVENALKAELGIYPEYDDMNYGEFIHYFFTKTGFGVHKSFMETISKWSEMTNELPDAERLNQELTLQQSGLSNERQIEMVCEVYEIEHERYLAARGETK